MIVSHYLLKTAEKSKQCSNPLLREKKLDLQYVLQVYQHLNFDFLQSYFS
jgi:hypothetical protein